MPRGSTATQVLPDNVLLLWTDTQAAAWLGKKKKTRHAGEHVQQTLGMFRYLFRYSKKEEEGRNERKRKKRGRAPELQLTHKQRHSMMLEELLIWYFLCDSHQWSSTDSGELLL